MSHEVIPTIVKEINCSSQYHYVIADGAQDYLEVAHGKEALLVFPHVDLGTQACEVSIMRYWLQSVRHKKLLLPLIIFFIAYYSSAMLNFF